MPEAEPKPTPAPPPFPGPKYFFPRKIGNTKFVDVKNIN